AAPVSAAPPAAAPAAAPAPAPAAAKPAAAPTAGAPATVAKPATPAPAAKPDDKPKAKPWPKGLPAAGSGGVFTVALIEVGIAVAIAPKQAESDVAGVDESAMVSGSATHEGHGAAAAKK